MSDDDSSPASPAADRGFRPLLDQLSTTYNFDFREYKEASLARRIRARMSQVHVDSFETYATYLDKHPGEHVALFNTILINVTGFFRDPEAWKALGEEIVPQIVAEASESRSIRIWSAGCSSGEELYSIAILFAEHLGDRIAEVQVKIYGTDVDEDALATARHGLYRLEQLKDVPEAIRDKYFVPDGQLYRFRRDLRRWCIFGAHNLAQAPPLSHVDLLVCRNVLIYFNSELQDRILTRFHYALREGAFMFLGRSESLLARSGLFTPVHLKWRLFQRLPGYARTAGAAPDAAVTEASPRPEPVSSGTRWQRALEALPSAVVIIDMMDTVLTWNPAAEVLFDVPVPTAVGRKFRDLDVSYRVEGLRARIEAVKARHEASRLEDVTFTRRSGELVHANISVAPLVDGNRLVGILVCGEEATEYVRLREQMSRVVEQHATAIEELQSTNEELETTNEELQSTNEELETTNEELQSTNEELETTVEELQATNAELGALNGELNERTAEFARLDAYHRGIVNNVDQGIVVVDRAHQVRTWNEIAERLWGVPAKEAIGRDFFSLPIGEVLRMARAPIERVLNGSAAEEVRAPRASGGEAVLRLTPVKDADSRVIGVVAVAGPDHDGRPTS